MLFVSKIIFTYYLLLDFKSGDRRKKVAELLEWVGLNPNMINRYPHRRVITRNIE
ncbi:MAG: hypothetical protein AAFQ80_01225 [Cyanobacteria bacterium J06621_8]